MLNNLLSGAGCVVLVVCLSVFVLGAGTDWKLGHLLMPEPVVIDGRYPSGRPVDPLTRTLVDAGAHQEVLFALAVPIGSGFVWLVWSIWRDERQRRNLLALDERNRLPCANRRTGSKA